MDCNEAYNHELQRYLSATEAVARILQIPLHVSSHGVQLISIHLPGEESVEVGDCGAEGDEPGEAPAGAVRFVSKMTRYFKRPDAPALDGLTIREYFNTHNHGADLPPAVGAVFYEGVGDDAPAARRVRRRTAADDESDSEGEASVDASLAGSGNDVDDDAVPSRGRGRGRGRGARGGRGRGRGGGRGGVRGRGRGGRGGRVGRGGSSVRRCDILIDSTDVPHWVWPKSRPGISRLPHLLPTQGEVYYLRILLLTVPARSFDELLTVNGVLCSSFRDAALRRHLVSDGHEAADALQLEVDSETSTPADLRGLYCLFIMHLLETGDPVQLFSRFWRAMSADIRHPDWRVGDARPSQEGLSNLLRKALLLRRINTILRTYGKSGENFGLPSQEDVEVCLSEADQRLLADEPTREDDSELRALQTRSEARAVFAEVVVLVVAPVTVTGIPHFKHAFSRLLLLYCSHGVLLLPV